MTADLVSWLTAQLDHDEQVARGVRWPEEWSTPDSELAAHVGLHQPEDTLRTVAAHRAILAEYERVRGAIVKALDKGQNDLVIALRAKEVVLELAVRALASIYEGRDGFDPAWKVDG